MDILDKLKSQIGDDVQHIFDHEALFKLAASEIENLRAELGDLHSARDRILCLVEENQKLERKVAAIKEAVELRDYAAALAL